MQAGALELSRTEYTSTCCYKYMTCKEESGVSYAFDNKQRHCVYLSILEVYQVLFGKSNVGKRPVVKGLWMSFRAQEILPVYKIDWHLLFPTIS